MIFPGLALLRQRGKDVTKAEKRLRVVCSQHAEQRSTVPGYFVCLCGCGYVGVCRHCVPDAPAALPWKVCDEAWALVQSGQARCDGEGRVYAV